jgi:EpsI family protein
MIARRDILIGAACVAAAGGAAALKPRREVTLLKGAKLSDVIPTAFGDWSSIDVGDPYAQNGGEKTLAEKLYSEQVVRQFTDARSGRPILALFAYGQRQSDELQLHRPEICYPAFGFEVVRNEALSLPLGTGVAVPARKLAAQAEDRKESIIYWSRMGELLPQSGGQQRSDRLRIAMQGVIPDGVLCRFSTPGDFPDQDWPALARFVADLVWAAPAGYRKVLVGTERGDALARARRA